MVIYIGADHRGFKLKETLKNYLSGEGYAVVDLGNDKYDKADDYPDFAAKVAEKVSVDSNENRGILICGAGVGVDVVANKFRGVRSVLALSEEQVTASRNDDDANIISIAADFVDEEKVKKMVDIWLKTPFSGEERHKRRLQKISEIEKGQA
ncbi:MAG: RpiB/LacA/LacB family sugar-phosphate isomerase [Candidatus Colwellbacteria bacterium]|nr:RpiB/LacA/LacB family sugar-phosphate isomerase [Candidatus Colwellbacteria bacterium]